MIMMTLTMVRGKPCQRDLVNSSIVIRYVPVIDYETILLI